MAESNGIIEKPKLGFFQRIRKALLIRNIQLPKINKNVKMRSLPFRLVLHKKHNRNLFSFACCNFAISYTIQTVIGKKFLEDFCLMTTSKA